MALPSFTHTVVARAAAALYGLQVGNGTMNWVLNEANSNAGGVNAVVNSVFGADFGSKTNAEVAALVVTNLGITGAGVSDARAYLEAALNTAGGNKGAAIAEAAALFSGMTADPVFGAAATAFNNRIESAVTYAQQAGTVDRAFSAGSLLPLSVNQDFLTGTAGDDVITARIFDNQNTLQSGDWVDGGAGNDRLEADLGSSMAFAITPETINVEHFVVRAQSKNGGLSGSDNNMDGEGRVIVDAERMNGVTRFDSNGSRADLIIEDVRTPLRTKDITIGMIGTDQGNVDYGVYFDRLRADSASVAQISIQLMDTRAASAGLDPLKDQPYNGFSFFINGEKITLKDPTPQSTDTATFNGAQTYDQLLAAVRKLLADNGLSSVISADFGPDFVAIDTKSGISATGRTIVLSGSGAGGVTLAVGNFIADDGVPADSGLHTVQSTATTSSTDLITSTVILDDVGRGSNGGDLVIGAKSTGETSGSQGIARFEITVENNSALGVIASTNEALKEVIVKNGDVNGTLKVQGYDNSVGLAAGGKKGEGSLGGTTNTNNNALPDITENAGNTGVHGAYGFSDVRKIDMSAMNGAVSYDAQVTPAAFGKYIQTTDTDPQPGTDNDSTDGKTTRQVADFDYTGGKGNDTIAVVIDRTIAASNSNVQVGREDFSFLIDGKAGDDRISLRMDLDGIVGGGTQNWYEHQHALKNVTVLGGEGNDTVNKPGSGDVSYDLGAGNDTLYTDNTGALASANTVITNSGRAIWVFNTDDQTTAADAARDVDDIQSTSNNQWYLYRASLTVTFLGTNTLSGATSTPADALESASVPIGFNPTTYKSSDLHINQAIKAAINNDPVLSKLLVAEDGPGYSLVVKSLIDGARAVDNIGINFTLPTSSQLTTTEVAKVAAAWETDFANPSTQHTGLHTLITTPNTSNFIDWMNGTWATGNLPANDPGSIGRLEGNGAGAERFDYQAALGNDGAGVDLVGADSTATSDNVITGSAGNDVIVLGTTDDGATTLGSSNDRVKFGADFGHDTIVNFTTNVASPTARDWLDLTAIGGFGSAGATYDAAPLNDATSIGDALLGDGAIYLQEYDAAGMSALTPAIIAGRFSTSNTTVDTDFHGNALSSETFVYIAVDPHNVGHVYKVVDTFTVDATVTKMGEIDLAEVPWSTLASTDFWG